MSIYISVEANKGAFIFHVRILNTNYSRINVTYFISALPNSILHVITSLKRFLPFSIDGSANYLRAMWIGFTKLQDKVSVIHVVFIKVGRARIIENSITRIPIWNSKSHIRWRNESHLHHKKVTTWSLYHTILFFISSIL